MKLAIMILVLALGVHASANDRYAIGKPISQWIGKPLPKEVTVKIVGDEISFFVYSEKYTSCLLTLWFNEKGIVTDFASHGDAEGCKQVTSLHHKKNQ